MKGGDLSFQPLDILVIDYSSLYDKDNEPKFRRMRLIPELNQNFDIRVWKEINLNNIFKKNNFEDIYELDFVEFISMRISSLRKYLKYHQSMILTSRQGILGQLGNNALDCFDSCETIVQKFDFIKDRE